MKSGSQNQIRDEMHRQQLGQWCHMTHKSRVLSAMRTGMNDDHHAAFVHASNTIPLFTDLVHMVEMLQNASGMSWDSRRMSWIRNGEEVRLNISKTSV